MLCFSKLRDNILLWSYYGDSHRGIVVGFDSEGLESALGAKALEVECREDRTIYDAEQFLHPRLALGRVSEFEFIISAANYSALRSQSTGTCSAALD
jgi:hypothetical protein